MNNIPWNKGKKNVYSKETLKKMSLAKLGKPISQEHKNKISEYNKKFCTNKRFPSVKGKTYEEMYGKEKSDILKEKRRISLLSKNPSSWLTGRKRSEESRKKSSLMWKGKKSHLWKGGVSKENELIRKSTEYKVWREKVFKRDNYICQFCKKVGGVLNADHIKPFSKYPELRFDVTNGRTLCVSCHRKTDTFGHKCKKYETK